MNKISALIALMCCQLAAMAQYARVNDIAYVPLSADDYSAERCRLDIYYPTATTDAPVVVWFHGGGIEGGSKEIPSQLQESGLVVVGVNYRLLPKAGIDQAIDDAAAAVAWTFKHAGEYNGSPKKIFLSGHSAGGYLIDMIGLDKSWLAAYSIDANDIAGLVPFSGQCITHFNVRKAQGISPLQPTIDRYAPLSYCRGDASPMVIISGDRELELYGRYEEQAYFYRMLKLNGLHDVRLYEMQGYNHDKMAFPAFPILKNEISRILGKQ